MLLKSEEGGHVNLDFVKSLKVSCLVGQGVLFMTHIPVMHLIDSTSPVLFPAIQAKAVVLEPMSSDTCLAVDGEEVPSMPMFIEVHPGLCRVLVAPEFEGLGNIL